jgi:hypothetical protein
VTREVCETCGALKNRNGPQDVMERNLWRFGISELVREWRKRFGADDERARELESVTDSITRISKAGDPREEEPSGSKHRS